MLRRGIGLTLLPPGVILGGYAATGWMRGEPFGITYAIIAAMAIAMILVGARYVFLKGGEGG